MTERMENRGTKTRMYSCSKIAEFPMNCCSPPRLSVISCFINKTLKHSNAALK